MSIIGHNNPPSPITFASEAVTDLGHFLADHPVIDTDDAAKEGALYVERARKTLADMEDARKAEVGPLNEQVKTINDRYRLTRASLDAVLDELRRRLTDFAAREEAKRIREAEEARQRALAAEMEARAAEEAECEAKANASVGEIADVAAAIVEADQAFYRFEKLGRAAAIAQRNTNVKLASQLGGRALSMRTKETLILVSYGKALKAIGPHPKIRDAILSVAREYRKERGHLPEGVEVETTRAI